MKHLLPLECDYAEHSQLHEIRTPDLRRVATVPIGSEAEYLVTAANAYPGLVEAAKAVLAYDNSILGRAAKGEVDLEMETSEGGIAYGEDLDALYFNMMDKAREALGDQDE